MCIIAFITHSADICQILEHIGVDAEPPHITPARGPPLWDGCDDTQMGDGVEGADVEPNWDEAAQPAPDFEVDRASVGKGWQQRFCQRYGAGLRLALPKNVQTEKSRATGPEQAFRRTQPEGL
jgi:hypothetical protein